MPLLRDPLTPASHPRLASPVATGYTSGWETLTRVKRGWERVSLLGTEQAGMLWCHTPFHCPIAAGSVPDVRIPCTSPVSPAQPESIHPQQGPLIGRHSLLPHRKNPKRLKAEAVTGKSTFQHTARDTHNPDMMFKG